MEQRSNDPVGKHVKTFTDVKSAVSSAHYMNNAPLLIELALKLEQSDDPLWRAASCVARGLADEVAGNTESALRHLYEGLSRYTELGDAERVANTHYRIGSIHSDIGSFDSAMDSFEALRECSLAAGDMEGVLLALNNIGNTHYYMSHTNEALQVWRKALAQAEKLNDRPTETALTLNIGNALSDLGESPGSMAQYRRAIALNEQGAKSKSVAALAYQNLGISYFYVGLYPDAAEAWDRSIELYEELADQRSLAQLKVNYGNLYSSLGDDEQAMRHYEEAIVVFERTNSKPSLANTYSNKANSAMALGMIDEAVELYKTAIRIYTEIDVPDDIVRVRAGFAVQLMDAGRVQEAVEQLDGLEEIQVEDVKIKGALLIARGMELEHRSDHDGAKAHYESARVMALNAGLRPDESRAHARLRDLCRKQGDLEGYISHNDAHLKIDEDAAGRDVTLKIAMLEKQKELAVIEKERERERAILYSTLPKHVADRVIGGEQVTDHFDDATVLFLDIANFTSISDRIPAGHVVHLLAAVFKVCDEVCESCGLTKIKTIGDSYLAVAGVPEPLADHQIRGARAALQMIQVLDQLELTMDKSLGDTSWTKEVGEISVRIGLHCGPLVAGVVGDQRMQYDVWGDTVNTASRMESTGDPGRIQVSDAFARALCLVPSESGDGDQEPGTRNQALTEEPSDEGPNFILTGRGEIEIKGKGTMKTFWLEDTD